MAAVEICPHGHRWEVPENHSTQSPAKPTTCPYCAAAGTLPPPGPDDPLVSALMSRWHERYERGEDVSAAELCREHPELVDELAQRIRALRSMQRFIQREGPSTTFGVPPTADGRPDTHTIPSADGAPRRPAPILPGYDVIEELGRGGMGVVYKARHIKLNRVVALKMILAGGHAGPGERVRFLAEAESVAGLQHPNIVALLEFGEHQGLPFFTLEFAANGSLAHRLDGVPQPPREAARLVEQLARGVHYAHTHGVVHRDLKPANVLLAEDGTPKITDFGLARRGESGTGLTATGDVLGTPSYIAPEQAGGETKHAGPAADIYALGAILYECLTGRPPFRAATTVETLLQVLGQEPVTVRQLQPQTPVDLATICHKCLQKEPRKRYASALELAEDCAAFLEGKPIRARPVGALSRGWRWCRRNRALAGALAVGVVSLFLGLIFSLTFAFRAETARQSEEARKGEADQARHDAQRQLVDLCAASGAAAAREGDHSLALLWFARAVQLAKDDPRQEELNRIRIANWLRQVCLPEGTFDVPNFRQNQDRFRQFQFSPDGNYLLVVATTGNCLVWDRRQRQLVSLPDAAAKSTAAAWQPRSNLLAVADKAGRIRFLAAPDFRPVDEVAAGGAVAVLAFSRDGKRLAWGGPDGARVWDRDEKKYMTPLLPHGGQVIAMSFNSTGDSLATADNDSKARVFRVPSEGSKPLFPPVRHVLPEDYYAHGGADRATPRFAAGDQVVLTVEGNGGDNCTLMWRSSTTGKLLGRSPEGAVFAVNEQGTYVASHGGSKGRLLRAQTREVLAPLLLSAPAVWNEHVIFSAESQTLVTCGWDTRARFWSVEDRKGVALSESHPSVYHPMQAVRVSLTADGRHLATALRDGMVCLWRMPSGPPIAYLAHAGGSTLLALSPDKKLVMPCGVSYRDGNLLETCVYDAETGKPAGPTLDPGGILIDAAFSPDGQQVATASSTGRTPFERKKVLFEAEGKGGNVQIWDWKTGKQLVGPIPMPTEPRGLAFRPDGHTLAVVCADYHVLLVDPKTGTIKHRLDPGPGLRTRPQDANQYVSNGEARFSPDGKFLVTWELTPHVHVWDPDQGKLLHTLKHNDRVGHVAFAPTNPELLATSGWGNDVRVWNLATGKVLVPLKHPQWVDHLLFSDGGKELMTGGADGVLRAWDWQANKLQDGWPFTSTWLGEYCFTADRRWLVMIGADELQVIDWLTKTPVSPRWKTKPHSTASLKVPAGDRRAVTGGFSPWLVGYDLERMRTPATDQVEELVALAELAAGRRILSQGNVVPLNSAEWAERWDNVRQKGMAALQKPPDADRQDGKAWYDLGVALHNQQDLGAAIDAYTKSLARDGNDAAVWHKLGLALLARQDRPKAIEAFRKAVVIDPRNAQAWFNLGNALRQQKDHPAATAAFKEAVALAPGFAEAHCNLGLSLIAQGDFAAALDPLRKGHALGSRRAGWPYSSAAWVKQGQQLLALEKKIPAGLQGQAASPAEYLSLAQLCQRYQKRYHDAARLYARALADEPKLPQHAVPVARYDAACAAALAAAGKGSGADGLSDREKAELRRQALDRLTADLSARRQLVERDPVAAVVLQPDLKHWREDADLAGVRDAKEVAKLSRAEQEAWHQLWADVEALQKEIRGTHTATRLRGTLTPARQEQVHPLTMSAGKTYMIDMESPAFDTYLRLEDNQGQVLAENDDISPSNLNSRIIFRPEKDGPCRIVATSFQRRGSGEYALTIRVFARQNK
jgi:WD40 repeat protein/tetratricopeptide (TPR) repeat protein/tRNA A-37 threonylcarbamoyl transferase component Bud32